MEVMIPRPAQPTPGSGPPDSTHTTPEKPVRRMILQVHVFAFFPQGVEDALLGQAAQQQAGGIRLGITAHHHYLAAHLGQTRHSILSGGGLADTTFAINRDLTHSQTPLSKILIRIEARRVPGGVNMLSY